jgi:hypothetical protein
MEGPMFLKLGQIFTIQSATYKEFESVTLANMKNYIPHISFLLPKIPILPSSNSENICIPKFLFKGKNEISEVEKKPGVGIEFFKLHQTAQFDNILKWISMAWSVNHPQILSLLLIKRIETFFTTSILFQPARN